MSPGTFMQIVRRVGWRVDSGLAGLGWLIDELIDWLAACVTDDG